METPATYAKKEIKAGRFPNMQIFEVCGEFHLCDNELRLLKSLAFKSKDAAMTERSKVIERAMKKA